MKLEPSGAPAPTAPRYLRAALAHPVSSIILVLAAGAAFVVSPWWLPVAAGLVAEGAWLAVARSSPGFRRRVEDAHRAEQRKLEVAEQQKLVHTLSEEDRRRFLELDQLRKEIHKLCASNPNVSLELMAGELGKLDRLVGSYLHIASAAARYEAYVAGSDLNALEEELRRQEAVVEKASDAESRALARKNLELIQRRAEKAAQLRKQLKGARGQLHLVENTVRLLRDQVVTMESPHELARELDELASSVEAIEATGRETEALLGGAERRALSERG